MKNYEQNRYQKRDPIGVGAFPIANNDYNHSRVNAILFEKEQKIKDNKASVYIHIPFCQSFCYFCGLNRFYADAGKIEVYLEALIKEMQQYAQTEYAKSLTIASVYFGGGTPTVLNNKQMERLLKTLFNNFSTDPNIEITVEGTIKSFDQERLSILKANGVTRISTGLQSLDDQVRKNIGLKDDADTVMQYVNNIKNNFENYNVDLIYNLPGQSVKSYERDLKIVMEDIDAPHLTINPFVLLRNAHLYKEIENGVYPFPSQEVEKEMFFHSLKIVGSYAREHYSVRDFCKEHCQCQYIVNNSYCNEILAFGAGAYGYVNGMVYTNSSEPDLYIKHVNDGLYPMKKYKVCTDSEILKRFMLMALRLTKCNLSKSIDKTGQSAMDVYRDILQDLQMEKFITISNDTVQFTSLGLFWGNNIRGEFAELNELDYIGYGLKGAGKLGRGNYI